MPMIRKWPYTWCPWTWRGILKLTPGKRLRRAPHETRHRLTVIQRDKRGSEFPGAWDFWLRCDCGRDVIVSAQDIVKGQYLCLCVGFNGLCGPQLPEWRERERQSILKHGPFETRRIRHDIARSMGVKAADVPLELAQAKLAHLKVKRLIKESAK